MRYVLTSPKFEGEIALEYSSHGIIKYYSNSAEMSEEQLQFWIEYFPLNTNMLDLLLKKSKTMVLTEVKQDLSFESFWEAYNYKVGNKKRCEKLWNGLSDETRLKVFKNIKAYDYYLTCVRNMQKLYPETYLNQTRYEVDYKALLKR